MLDLVETGGVGVGEDEVTRDEVLLELVERLRADDGATTPGRLVTQL